MGMFDRVWVPCPDCGHLNEFQSKTGGCYLSNYYVDDVPKDVVVGIDGDWGHCIQCGRDYRVIVCAVPTIQYRVSTE